MVKFGIKMGDIVEISLLHQKKDTHPHIGIIEEFDKKNTVLIHAPISSGAYVKLSKDEKYSLKFITKKGIYRINALISEYKVEGNINFVELKMIGEGEHVQQRSFFRLPCLINIEFVHRTEDKTEILFSEEKYKGIIRDLSAGGMKMVSKLEIGKRDIIKFNLSLGNASYELNGEIMYKVHIPEAVQPYMYGIMFLGLSKVEQEKIIQHLHNLQLKNLR